MENLMHKIIDDDFEDLLKDLQSSLMIRSVYDESLVSVEHPFGPEISEALEGFLKCAEKLGFMTANISNYAGYAEMGSGEKLVGILAHLDVVPEGETAAWSVPPYSGKVVEGRLYGRGSLDDKGPAFSVLYAMKALRDSGFKLECRIRLIVGLDEESGGRCIARYLETEEIPGSSFSPDANFPLINAEKGIFHCWMEKKFSNTGKGSAPRILSIKGGERYNVVPDSAEAVFDGLFEENIIRKLRSAEGVIIGGTDGKTIIRAKGVSAHAMSPELGTNAVELLLKALSSFDWEPRKLSDFVRQAAESFKDTDGAGLGLARKDEVSGSLTFNTAMIKLDNGVCRLSFDLRYPVTLSGAELAEDFKKSAEKLGAKFFVDRDKKPLFVDPSSPLIKKLLEAYKKVTGSTAEPLSIGGGTYCRYLPNSVSFGPVFPGEPDVIHQPDEHVTLENLRKITHIYAEAIMLLAV
ncbi:MAG: putative dipeptidase [Synergistaceae bacterium]|nr:dipeptidase PepV [Synergistaceae bacterium]